MYKTWTTNICILAAVLFVFVNVDLGVSYTMHELDSMGDKISDAEKIEHSTRLTKHEQHKVINRALLEYNSQWCENCTNRFDMFMLFKFTDQIIFHGTLRRVYLEIGETFCPKKVEAPDCQFRSGFGWNKHLMCIFEVTEESNATVKNAFKEFRPKCLPKTVRLLRMFTDIAHMTHAEAY